MRFLKVALIVVAAVLVIAAGAVAYLVSRIDEDALVREAQDLVKQATGRTLAIDGNIDLRKSLAPAVVAEEVRLSNASWGSRPDMVRARRLEVELDLLPLLRGVVRIRRLVAIGPDLLLETDGKGRGNWELDAEASPAKPADSAAGPLPVAIETGELLISDGVLVYRNGAFGTQTRVEIEALDIDRPGGRGLRTLALKGAINRRAFELNGELGDPARLLVPGETFPVELVLTGPKSRISAKGRVTDAAGRADAQIQLELESADVQDLAAIFDRAFPPLGPLKASATVERADGRLGMRDLDLALGRPGALQVSARGSFADLLRPAGAALDFSASAPASPRVPAFAASGRLEDFDGGVRMSDLNISSGPNELKGSFAYRSGKARPQVVASLQGAALDLGFLAPAATPAEQGEVRPQHEGAVFPREPLPLGRIRAVDANGEISLGALVLPNRMTLRNFSAKFELNSGRLRVDPVHFLAGGGSTTAAIVLDASRGVAALSGQLTARRVVLGDLLAGTSMEGKVQGGPTDVDVKLTTTGSSAHEWAAGLNGNLQAVVGAARANVRQIDYGSDLLTRLAEAINPFRDSDPDLRLRCAVLRVQIANGVAVSDRGFGAEADKISVLSSGAIDLGRETLDVDLRPRVKEGIGLGGARLAEMVRVTGPLNDPKLGLDFKGAIGATASIAAGVATAGLSILGEKLLATAAGEDACKIASQSASSQSASSAAGPGVPAEGDVQRTPGEPSPADSKKSKRGLFDGILGN